LHLLDEAFSAAAVAAPPRQAWSLTGSRLKLGDDNTNGSARFVCEPDGNNAFLSLDNRKMNVYIAFTQGPDRLFESNERTPLESLQALSNLVHPDDGKG